jgi:hypothetical protein
MVLLLPRIRWRTFTGQCVTAFALQTPAYVAVHNLSEAGIEPARNEVSGIGPTLVSTLLDLASDVLPFGEFSGVHIRCHINVLRESLQLPSGGLTGEMAKAHDPSVGAS